MTDGITNRLVYGFEGRVDLVSSAIPVQCPQRLMLTATTLDQTSNSSPVNAHMVLVG